MAEDNKLLSREELLALWHEIAASFGTELEVTVDNGAALALRLTFPSQFGETEISIKDSFGSGTGGSGLATSVISTCNSPLKENLKISLPPLFGLLFPRFYKNVSSLYLEGTQYWVKSESAKLRAAIDPDKIENLSQFHPLHFTASDKTVALRTVGFLGKADQIQAFARLHISLAGLVYRA